MQKYLFFLFFVALSNAQILEIRPCNFRFDILSLDENARLFRKDVLTSQIKLYEPSIFGIQKKIILRDLSRSLLNKII